MKQKGEYLYNLENQDKDVEMIHFFEGKSRFLLYKHSGSENSGSYDLDSKYSLFVTSECICKMFILGWWCE